MSDVFWDRPVLGIETSCDETAASVVVGREVLSNVVASQTDMHAEWGGIVPEAASRAHVEAIIPVVHGALREAGVGVPAGIAVTNRPGLVGSLSVGVSAAQALALAWGVPIVGVHHLEGHIFSPYSLPSDEFDPGFPHLCLIASGGHTELVRVAAPGDYEVVAATCDDAAGEAFDKGARLLGLGYPGGRQVQEMASGGDPAAFSLPVELPKSLDRFSFSGLKTAMLRLVESEGKGISVPDACASLQEAIVSALAGKVALWLDEAPFKDVALVGGVAANSALRGRLAQTCHRFGVPFWSPPIDLCTDNAAMIALAGSFRLARGECDGTGLDVFPNSPLP